VPKHVGADARSTICRNIGQSRRRYFRPFLENCRSNSGNKDITGTVVISSCSLTSYLREVLFLVSCVCICPRAHMWAKSRAHMWARPPHGQRLRDLRRFAGGKNLRNKIQNTAAAKDRTTTVQPSVALTIIAYSLHYSCSLLWESRCWKILTRRRFWHSARSLTGEEGANDPRNLSEANRRRISACSLVTTQSAYHTRSWLTAIFFGLVVVIWFLCPSFFILQPCRVLYERHCEPTWSCRAYVTSYSSYMPIVIMLDVVAINRLLWKIYIFDLVVMVYIYDYIYYHDY